MNERMTEERFRALAEAYGSALERWPSRERTAARELLLMRPELRDALAEEAALDRLFAEAPAELSDSLLARLEAVVETPQPFPLKTRSLLVPALGWAVAAAVGLWLGTSLGDPEIAAITGGDAITADSPDAGDSEDADQTSLLELAAGDLASFEEGP